MEKGYNCIDSGSAFCPCELASTLDCISCSHLRGEDSCDCNWNGVCILYEYYMNNMKSRGFRLIYEGLIVDKKEIEKDLFLIKISVEEDLIKELNSIGSYVFIKKFGENSYYNAPMSVLDVGKKFIYIVYYELGPKTKGINKGEKINIKGPYWNGIIGKNRLSDTKNSRILIYARGIGQSSIVIPIKKLAEKNQIFLFLDKGKTDSFYCLDFIDDLPITVKEINLFDPLDRNGLLNFIKEESIDIVISAAAEMAHREIKTILEELDSQISWFITNNNILCCGEGICGSCIRKINSGDRIKTCKTIVDPMNFY